MEIKYILEICVAIDIAILSIAYPIIIDKISKIGDKYSSEYISIIFNNEIPQRELTLNLFKKEYKCSCFKLLLYITIFSFLFLIFEFQPLFGLNLWIVNKSAKIIVLSLSALLVFFFIKWLNKVELYHGSSTHLLRYLIEKYNKKTDNDNTKTYCLKAINEIAYYAMLKQDIHIQETLLEFYYDVFINERRRQNGRFSSDLYLCVTKLNKIAVQSKTDLRDLEYYAVSGLLLLGEFDDTPISHESYRWLWRNICIISDTSRLIRMFWRNSNNYFARQLINPRINYTFKDNEMLISNQHEVNRIKEEQHRFLEFHYALGGVLLFKNQFTSLLYIFEYSLTTPPSYLLLPTSTTEIFFWFNIFRQNLNGNEYFDTKYNFPDLDHLGNINRTILYICDYLALLFIRHVTLYTSSSTPFTIENPKLPATVLELYNWYDGVSEFENHLNRIYSRTELISALHYDETIKSKKRTINAFLRTLKQLIKNKIKEQKLNTPLSMSKIESFYEKSNEIISDTFNLYKHIFIKKDNSHSDCRLKLSLNGEKVLISKSAFTEGDIYTAFYDTFLAESISEKKIKFLIPNAFTVARTKRYLFNEKNLLIALEKLISSKDDAILIGINILDDTKHTLNKSRYSEKTRFIVSTDYHLSNTIFVLQKKDLPAIEHVDISDKLNNINPINEELKVFASVNDINTSDLDLIKQSDEYELKVEVAIAFIWTIYWRNDRDVIEINIATQYREQGIQNDINDIEPL